MPARPVGAHRPPRPARAVRADDRLPRVLGSAVGRCARRSHRPIRAGRDRRASPRRPAAVGARADRGARRDRAHRAASAAPFAASPARCGAASPPHPHRIRPACPPAPPASCGTCAWRFEQRGARAAGRPTAKVDPAWPGCERYEAALDCQTCGACCRAAYHSVEVARRDPAVKKQPDYIVDRGTYLEIRRDGDRCAALHGGVVEADTAHAVPLRDLRRPSAHVPRLHARLRALPDRAPTRRAQPLDSHSRG